MKLPIADTATVRAYTGVLFRKHRRPLVLIAVLHTLAATAGLAGPWLLGHARRRRHGRHHGDVHQHADRRRRRRRARADRAHPVRAAGVDGVRRGGVRRAARGVHREGHGPAAVRRRAGRHRRPRGAHDERRQQAAARGAVRRPARDRRGRDHHADDRRVPRARRRWSRSRCSSACPSLLLVVRWYLKRATPGLPARVGRVRGAERDDHRVRRGRPHGRRPAARPAPDGPRGRRPARGVRGREGDAAPAHDPVPGHRRGVRPGTGGRAAVGRLPRVARATSPSARSPRSCCTRTRSPVRCGS